ncbi:MAG: condensation domain-containing protein, partial [Acidobacteriota bacterium]|nr:condensation domain-containing protein [Acidobacteriota bacterium]
AQKSYWRRQLKGATALDFSAVRQPGQEAAAARPARLKVEGVSSRTLGPELWGALQAFNRREQVTPFMTAMTAFVALLHKYTGREDICVTTDFANRTRKEFERVMGFFSNRVILRMDLSHDPGLRELLKRVRGVVLDGYAHQSLPFLAQLEVLGREYDYADSFPLHRVQCQLLNLPNVVEEAAEAPAAEGARPAGAALPITHEDNSMESDLILRVREATGELVLEYDTGLFTAALIERMWDYLEAVLRAIAADPDRRLSELPPLAP